jgi:hypothetical protein
MDITQAPNEITMRPSITQPTEMKIEVVVAPPPNPLAGARNGFRDVAS